MKMRTKLTRSEMKALIQDNAEAYHALSDDEELDYVTIENEVIHQIFQHIIDCGFEVEGLDLQKLLDAEDDDDEGVPPEGVESTMLTLIERISDSNHPSHIETSNEIKDLFKLFHKSFWPDSQG